MPESMVNTTFHSVLGKGLVDERESSFDSMEKAETTQSRMEQNKLAMNQRIRMR